jgi:hypothetical protein
MEGIAGSSKEEVVVPGRNCDIWNTPHFLKKQK